MRIISGTRRGLKLNTPKDDNVRPTTDRVKESLFNIINAYVMESDVLDLFAGTGSLGIECISRGANKSTFVDLNKESIKIVKSNIQKAGFEEKSNVINADYKEAIRNLGAKGQQFDLIFMDPPYYKDMFVDSLNKIQESNILREDGLIVVEHDSKEELPETINKLTKTKIKKYGNTTITLYQVEE